MARYDDINSRMVAYATVLSCVFLFVIVQLIAALTYFWSNSSEDAALAASEYSRSKEVIGEQRSTLSGYKWVQPPAEEGSPTQPEKKLHIPIERAQEVVLEEMTASKT